MTVTKKLAAGAWRRGAAPRSSEGEPATADREATIEGRLERKAAEADRGSPADARSLGRMSRDERRKLLFG